MPHRWATSEIAVLSPPGMMRASQELSSVSVLISLKVQLRFVTSRNTRSCTAFLRSCTCSLKAPWSAKTPTVMSSGLSCTAIFYVQLF